jgi:hypothetical protein
VNGLLNFRFVFSGIKLLVDRVLDEHVQQRVFGDVEKRCFGMSQH